MDDVWDETDDLGEARKWSNRRRQQKSSETTADIGDDDQVLLEELKTRLDEVLPRSTSSNH